MARYVTQDAMQGFRHGREQAEALAVAMSLKEWLASLREDDAAAYRYVLFMRFALINLIALGLVGAAYFNGWVSTLIAADTTRLVLIITTVFITGLAMCGRKVWQTSVELNATKEPYRYPSSRVGSYLESIRGLDGQARSMAASALKLKLATRIAPVRHVANSLVILGLIGTVIGFMIALSGVEAGAAGDIDAIAPMVSTLIGGMSVALHTTLVGAILNVWLMINYRLLEHGAVKLLTATVELGERHARS